MTISPTTSHDAPMDLMVGFRLVSFCCEIATIDTDTEIFAQCSPAYADGVGNEGAKAPSGREKQ
jgi:hypothetical protein